MLERKERKKDRSRLRLDIALLEYEVLADHALPNILHVLDDGLEVRRRVVGASDEDVVGLAGGRGGI